MKTIKYKLLDSITTVCFPNYLCTVNNNEAV